MRQLWQDGLARVSSLDLALWLKFDHIYRLTDPNYNLALDGALVPLD